MTYSIKEMRKLTDDQLIEEHDSKAVHTVVGTGFYIEELDRRSRNQASKTTTELSMSTLKLAKRTYILSWITAIIAFLAIGISLFA